MTGEVYIHYGADAFDPRLGRVPGDRKDEPWVVLFCCGRHPLHKSRYYGGGRVSFMPANLPEQLLQAKFLNAELLEILVVGRSKPHVMLDVADKVLYKIPHDHIGVSNFRFHGVRARRGPAPRPRRERSPTASAARSPRQSRWCPPCGPSPRTAPRYFCHGTAAGQSAPRQ